MMAASVPCACRFTPCYIYASPTSHLALSFGFPLGVAVCRQKPRDTVPCTVWMNEILRKPQRDKPFIYTSCVCALCGSSPLWPGLYFNHALHGTSQLRLSDVISHICI